MRYAGASLDFNPIHWNDQVAEQVGLPGVVAHGMLTMALACRLITEWTGDPGAVVDYGARFTRPIVVPNDATGALLELTGKVTDRTEDGHLKVTITAKFEDKTVLAKAVAVVRAG